MTNNLFEFAGNKKTETVTLRNDIVIAAPGAE